MEMENNRPSTSGRPVRTTMVPARLQDTGESGAAAGLGQSRSSQGITREALPRCAGRAASVDAPEGSSAPRLPLASLGQASKSVGIDDDSGRPAENTPARFRLQQVGKDFSSGSDIDKKKEERSFDVEDEFGLSPAHEKKSSVASSTAAGTATLPASPQRSSSCLRVGTVPSPTPTAGALKKTYIQASVDRAIGRKLPYQEFATQLLQKLCTRRGLRGMSRVGVRSKLADKLYEQDIEMKRSSPYYDDLQQIGQGTAASSAIDVSDNTPAIPAGVVLALRNVLETVPRKPTHNMTYNGNTYLQADVFAVIDAENSKENSKGKADVVHAKREPVAGRKTRHSVHRLLACMILDKHRHDLIASRQQAKRSELDVHQVGADSGAWQRLLVTFKDDTLQLPRVTNHVFAANTDPNILSQPDITPKKLKLMFDDIKKIWNPCWGRKTGTESGTHAAWEDLCLGNTDIFVMGEAVGAYPELDQICNALLPEELQREDAGIADESPATSSASRRASTKRTGRELHAQNRNGVVKTKRTKRELVAEKTADRCTDKALLRVSSMFPTATGNSKWRDITDEAESASAVLSLRTRQNAVHKAFSEDLAAATVEDPEGVGFRVKFLEREIKRLETDMLGPDIGGGAS